jgi:hypothetical protein
MITRREVDSASVLAEARIACRLLESRTIHFRGAIRKIYFQAQQHDIHVTLRIRFVLLSPIAIPVYGVLTLSDGYFS